MIVEAIIIGVFIFIGSGMIGVGLREIRDTMKLILERYAALENLGIFPPYGEKGVFLQPTGSHKTDPFVEHPSKED